MYNRIRSPRERRLAVSMSQPAALKSSSHKLPFILPSIKSKHRKPTFYEQIIISPDYVDISRTQKSSSAKGPECLTNNSSRVRSIISSRPNKSLIQKMAQEDRIVQRYEQQQQRYKQMVKRIKQKSISRQKKQQRSNLKFIYQRFMGIL